MSIRCPFCSSGSLKVHQKNGHAYSIMYRCADCKQFFSERRFTGYSGLKLPPEKIVQIVNCLCEGVSVRATARLIDVQKNTVLRVMRHAARLCQEVMNKNLRNLSLKRIQADELWCFTKKKEANVMPHERENGEHVGDTWIWLATDAETKLIPCFYVGDRDLNAAKTFMHDLASRLASRCQLTSDGLRAYIWAVEQAFGSEVDYGMMIKHFAHVEGEMVLVGALPKPITGDPDLRHISTSYAERNNLNCRTFMRRLVRLGNGFSKKLENLVAALTIYLAHYNFVRVHGSLRISPAMAANVTDHLWTIEELLNAGAAL